MSNNKRHPSAVFLLAAKLIPLVFFICLVIATEALHRQLQKNQQVQQKALLTSYAEELATILEYELKSSVLLSQGLAGYIRANGGEPQINDIEPWLAPLTKGDHYLRNIAVAPANTVTQVYPLKGNENVIGLHYPHNINQWPEIETIILSQRPMLTGPLPLVQGGTGLIYRIPVYLDKYYWGMVSTVIDADALFAFLDQRARNAGIEFTLIDGRSNRRYWRLLWGNKDLIDAADIVIPLQVPERNWQLLARQENPHTIDHYWIRILGWPLALLLSALIYICCNKKSRSD